MFTLIHHTPADGDVVLGRYRRFAAALAELELIADQFPKADGSKLPIYVNHAAQVAEVTITTGLTTSVFEVR